MAVLNSNQVCAEHRLKRWIGTRAIKAAAKFAGAGWSDHRIITTLICGWTSTELAKLAGLRVDGRSIAGGAL